MNCALALAAFVLPDSHLLLFAGAIMRLSHLCNIRKIIDDKCVPEQNVVFSSTRRIRGCSFSASVTDHSKLGAFETSATMRHSAFEF